MTLLDYFIENTRLGTEWASDKNENTPDTFSPNTKQKAWWRCEKGHEWQASIGSRVSLGRNCPYCAGQAVFPGENDLETLVPAIAALWHPNRNGELLPSGVTPGSKKYVWWQCTEGHDWQAPVYSVTGGTGCPYCSGRLAIPGETDLVTTHPEIAKLWHERNPSPPSAYSAGSHKKVWWLCEKGHEWESVIDSVAQEGTGCPYCAGKRAIPGETDLQTLFPEIAEQWDVQKNGDLTPSSVLPSGHNMVWWNCEKGHSWQTAIFSRTRGKGTGCPYCTGRKVLEGFNDLAYLKPKLAEQWYQPLNGSLKPTDVTLGSNKRVWWQCADGHIWRAYIYSRTRKKGAGCPVCAGTVRAPRLDPSHTRARNQARLPQSQQSRSADPERVCP